MPATMVVLCSMLCFPELGFYWTALKIMAMVPTSVVRSSALLTPDLLQRQREGNIDFPDDISISVLLNGVPLPQSPLLPTGMTAVAKSISSQKKSSKNLAVRFLMENAASSIHSFDLQQRCLRALASFTLSEVESVAGPEDADKVYSAAWKMVLQRGRSRRHSTKPFLLLICRIFVETPNCKKGAQCLYLFRASPGDTQMQACCSE